MKYLIVLTCFLISSSVANSQHIKPIPDWDSRIIENAGHLPTSFRNQVADLIYLGDRRFGVAYLDAKVTDGEFGNVQLIHVDLEKEDIKLYKKNELKTNWLRAATGGPIDLGGCPQQLQLSVAEGASIKLKQNPEYINYFTYKGTVNDVTGVTLLKVRWCNGGFSSQEISLDEGFYPSAAIGKSNNETKLLIVYVNNRELLGQFVNPLGERIGEAFTIAPIDGGILSTDIIWNPVSQKFIVGYMRGITSIDSLDPELCSVNNVLVDWNGVVDTPVVRGACDSMRNGHHTFVDYNPQGNKNGRYYWWYQDLQGDKALHLMDSIGRALPDHQLIGTAWTYPVGRTRRKKIKGPFVSVPNPQTDVIGNYSYIRRVPGVGRRDSFISVEFLTNSGNVDKLGTLPGKYSLEVLGEFQDENVYPVSWLNLYDETVLLWRHNLTSTASAKRPPEPGWITDNAQWGLTVFKQEKKPPVFSRDD